MESHDETARRIVAQEVCYCVSSLVSALLRDDSLIDEDAAFALAGREPGADEYRDANDYAGDGATIIVDAADSEGWHAWRVTDCDGDETESGEEESETAAWRAAFDAAGRDHPDGAEAFEHWLVSDWLAGKLRDHGESVVELDNLGLTIWARCTTGQAIYMDHVIQTIAANLVS